MAGVDNTNIETWSINNKSVALAVSQNSEILFSNFYLNADFYITQSGTKRAAEFLLYEDAGGVFDAVKSCLKSVSMDTGKMTLNFEMQLNPASSAIVGYARFYVGLEGLSFENPAEGETVEIEIGKISTTPAQIITSANKSWSKNYWALTGLEIDNETAGENYCDLWVMTDDNKYLAFLGRTEFYVRCDYPNLYLNMPHINKFDTGTKLNITSSGHKVNNWISSPYISPYGPVRATLVRTL